VQIRAVFSIEDTDDAILDAGVVDEMIILVKPLEISMTRRRSFTYYTLGSGRERYSVFFGWEEAWWGDVGTLPDAVVFPIEYGIEVVLEVG